MVTDELIGLLHHLHWAPDRGRDLLKVPMKQSSGLVFRTTGIMAFQKRLYMGSYRSYYLGKESALDVSDRTKAHELVQRFREYKILDFDKEEIEEIILTVEGRKNRAHYLRDMTIRSTKGNFRLNLAGMNADESNDHFLILMRCLVEFAREKISVVPYKGKKKFEEAPELIELFLDTFSDVIG